MFSEFFSRKMLSLSGDGGSLQATIVPEGDSTSWCCDLIPEELDGGLFDVVAWIAGDQVASALSSIVDVGEQALDPVISIEGTKLSLLGLLTFEVERLRFNLEKGQSSNGASAPQSFTLAFSGNFELEGLAELSGDLVIQIKEDAPLALQFQLADSAQLPTISIPLAGLGDDLRFGLDITALDMERDKSVTTGAKTFALIGNGILRLQGGPSWLDNLWPDELEFTLSMINSSGTGGKAKRTLSLVVPELMDDVNITIPTIPTIIDIGLPELNFGSVNIALSNLAIILDSTKSYRPYLSIECGVGLPDSLNRLAGSKDNGEPRFAWINSFDANNPEETRLRGRLSFDGEKCDFALLSSPFTAIQTEPKSTVVGNTEGSVWVLDFGDNGLLHIDVPTLSTSPTTQAMSTSGGFEIKRPLSIPVSVLKSLIDGVLFDGASDFLPDSIPIKSINLLDGDELNIDALRDLFGGSLPDVLEEVVDQIETVVERLPDGFKSYLNFTIPDSLSYYFRMDAKGSCAGGVCLPEDQPLRLIIPMGIVLTCVEIRQISLGQLNGGALGILEVDAAIDYFYLPEMLLGAALDLAHVPMLPEPDTLSFRFNFANTVSLINFQTGIPVPIFYDEISLHRLGVEGIDLASEFHLPKPKADVLNLASFAATLVDFITLPPSNPAGLLDADKVPDVLDTAFVIGQQYFQTPEYLGNVVLGQKGGDVLSIGTDDVWPFVAHSLNFLKTGRIDEFLQVLPLEYRVGNHTLDCFGLAEINVAWLISSPKEFREKAYEKLALAADDSATVLRILPEVNSDNRLMTIMHGSFELGPVELTNTQVFSGGFTGATTGFRFTGEIASLVGVDIFGKVSLEADPASLIVAGDASFSLLGTEVLQGRAGINVSEEQAEIYLSGLLDLFPGSNILSLRSEIDGKMSTSGVRIYGATDLAIGGVSIIEGEILLTHDSLSVRGQCLGLEAEAFVGNRDGVLEISGALRFDQSLNISTGPIVIQGIKVCDPINLSIDCDIDLAICLRGTHFSLGVHIDFNALDQGFMLDFDLDVMPSSMENFLEELPDRIVDLLEDSLSDLLNSPEKLLEAIIKAPLALTNTRVTALSLEDEAGKIGVLNLQSRFINMNLLSTYAEGGNDLSRLFAYCQATNSSMKLATTQVEKIAVLIACNRQVKMPALDKIDDFPLIKQLKTGDDIGKDVSEKGIVTARAVLDNVMDCLPYKKGTYTLAAGFKANSFKLMNSTNIFLMEVGGDLAAYLVGTTSLKLPPKPLTTVVNMEMNYRGAIDLLTGNIKIEGKLTNNSYLLSKKVQLTGGFAYYSWLSGEHAGDFVVTMGGYAPSFRRPSHYPAVSRLGLLWKLTSQLNVKGSLYMALTPTSIMAGGALRAVFKTGPFHASFAAALNFLMSWQPFYYQANIHIAISAGVTLKVKISYGFGSFTIRKTFRTSLGAELDVWGPDFTGRAKVKWSLFSCTIKFGSGSKPKPQPISWNQFKAAYLANGQNLTPECVVKNGLLEVIEESGKTWHLVDPDQVELSCDSQFPLKKLTLKPMDQQQADKAWSVTEKDNFYLAPMDSSKAEDADDWYLALEYDGPDGLYFQGEETQRPYPKAVWGDSFKPKTSRNPVLSLLSGARIIPSPGKPPGFTDAIDADEFKFQDLVENDPVWQWGTEQQYSFNDNEAENLTAIHNSIMSDDAQQRRQALADFIDYDEPLSLAGIAQQAEGVFIGVPSSVMA